MTVTYRTTERDATSTPVEQHTHANLPTATQHQAPNDARIDAGRAKGGSAASGVAVEESQRLGLWTTTLHRPGVQRRAMRSRLAEADDRTLADEHLYWVSELGRITELVGMLNAQEVPAALAVKVAKARARVEARRRTDGKQPTQSALDDLADVDPVVIEAEQQLGRIRSLLASAAAAKEATAGYVQGLSREITLRGDGKRAHLY